MKEESNRDGLYREELPPAESSANGHTGEVPSGAAS
jgi:hypothetical protein